MPNLVRHHCTKPKTDPTYSPQWSGVTFTSHCYKGCVCPKCGEKLHAEGGSHYCPSCDDYVTPAGPFHEARTRKPKAK